MYDTFDNIMFHNPFEVVLSNTHAHIVLLRQCVGIDTVEGGENGPWNKIESKLYFVPFVQY